VASLPTAAQAFLTARNGLGDVYAYDKAYRLVDARYDVSNPATEVATPGSQPYVRLVQYALDGLGNRSQVSTTVPPGGPANVLYAFDVVNQYTAIGGVNRTHDNNGNLVDDGTYLFGYDFRNRLVEVRLKSTQALVSSYRYDALGRRVEKAVSGAATTRYVLDGVQVVEEFDGAGNWQVNYVYEDGIDQPRSMDRADLADVNGNQNTSEILRFHYHQQALGSVTEMTDYTGAVCEWVTYDVYGLPNILNQQGSAITQSAIGNPYLYTGREFDPESGLYHYRARAYDPQAGRFLQRDPAGYVDGLGLYEGVSSSPATARDPLGLWGEGMTGLGATGLSDALFLGSRDALGAMGSQARRWLAWLMSLLPGFGSGCGGSGTQTPPIPAPPPPSAPESGPLGHFMRQWREAKQAARAEAAEALRPSEWGSCIDCHTKMLMVPGYDGYGHLAAMTADRFYDDAKLVVAAGVVGFALGLWAGGAPPRVVDKVPFQGEPGETYRQEYPDGSPKQDRTFGEDGYPSRDIDYGHDHGQGDPHEHEWGRPEDGGPPTHRDRGTGKPLD
jgi:RHS repeat-associated protein